MLDSNRYDEFVELLQRATGQILAYLNALLLNFNDAEDVFQESCVVLWQKFDEFQPGTNFLAWALRIARFKAMDFQKSRARRNAPWKQELQISLLSELISEKENMNRAPLEFLADCMKKLAEGDLQLVQTCYGDGVPVRQIADELSRSPQSVHNSLRRIRLMLLGCIERLLNRENVP
jgi:RNA polymerase sigma-70 factor (ECF subfamily)